MKASLVQMISILHLTLEIIKEKSKFQKLQEFYTDKIIVFLLPSANSVLTLNKYIGSSRNIPDLC